MVIASVAGVVAVAVYQTQIAPLRTTVLVVDGKRIQMDYFLKRVRMSGQPPLAVLQALSFEEIVKAAAALPPYRIAVTDEEIEDFLRQEARGDGASLTPDEYAEWFRQQLNESRLSAEEFRDLTRARLLIRRLQDVLGRVVPGSAEQVRLKMIVLTSVAAAEQTKARLDGGADFAVLADELNTVPELRGKGGDLGWRSRAGLAPQLARLAFDELAVGEVSTPIPLDASTFVIVLVSERAMNRPLSSEELEAAKRRALEDWVAGQFRTRKVEYHGFDNGYDSDTDAWVRAEVQRMNSMAGATP